MDTEIVSTITSHGPGYLNKDLEKSSAFKPMSRLNGRFSLRRHPNGKAGMRILWF